MEQFNELVKKLIEIGGLVGLVVGILITAIGWLIKQTISHLLKEDIEKYKAQLQEHNNTEILRAKSELDRGMAAYKQQIEAIAKSEDRIRSEILAWANPILGAVNELESRLRNILTTKGYGALEAGFSLPEWSVTYDYFLNSTLFLFGQYFCWTHMLYREVSFELFRSQKEMKEFFSKVDRVNGKLSDFPPIFEGKEKEYDGTGHDSQIFRLQQRAIGETLATRRGNRRACRSYAYFLSQVTDQNFSSVFEPVRKLIDKVKPGERRWHRLLDAHAALIELQNECNRMLKVPER